MPLTLYSLALDEANVIIGEIIDRARNDNGAPVAVAVVGASGQLISFAAMDGVAPASIKLSQSKAYSAVIGQRDTAFWASFPKNDNSIDFDMRNWTDADFTGFTGGVILKKHEMVIGGIGVSGRKGKMSEKDTILQDNELADYGRTLIYEGNKYEL